MADDKSGTTDEQTASKDKADKKPVFEDEKAIETSHEITIGERTLKYKATVGRLPLKNYAPDKSEIEAQVFFTYYAAETDKPLGERPLTFAFNGGPGSASVWVHLGALGPQRVVISADGTLLPPPYKLEANPHTWLTETDLVFIDPVGTGYSQAKDEETAKKYYDVDGDIASIGEFMRLFLTRYDRWTSPLYIAGESYGTTRGAGLAGYLIDRGIAFAGIIFISTVLSMQTIRFREGNDLPYALYVPAYTATAWYHNQLAPELQARELTELLKEVEEFAFGAYTLALMQGDRLGAEARTDIVNRLAHYTGLSKTYVENRDLRIEHWRFCKELLRDRGVIVGRLDSRLTAREGDKAAEAPDFDASGSHLRPPFTVGINDYLRRSLGYVTDQPYMVSGDNVNGSWKWANGTFTETTTALAAALAKNNHMRVLFTCGYYDLATPYTAAEYTAAHLGIDASLLGNLSFTYYPAGHMMYVEESSLVKLAEDIRVFYAG